ncbi:MAG: TIGR02099 family protein, partial [Gammaproteobacteria bacterium]|nr:TIGR02099 family protein [Gammaproteobacteria bacterium]
RQLPAVELKADNFVYGKVDFGRMQLRASKFAYGWRVDKLELNAPSTMVNGSGAWTYDGKQHQSRFDVDVLSEDVGVTMNTFGYANGIAGGTGHINLHAAWAAPLADAAPEKIDGKLTLDFKKGRMLELNPGAGRLFALLSIQALPRRLALDFSDLFSKGFAFDDIKGEFRLEHGEAYTSNLAMNGPAAKVRATGRVGLSAHDYDQHVHVIPDLTASVPALTAIAAASPQIGVATYLLGKIFQTQIDEAAGVDYTITGSWDSPQVERVTAAVSPASRPSFPETE